MAADLKFFKPISFHSSNLKVADIKDLIKQGADINERDDAWRDTPLLLAAQQKNEELAIGLIAHGANVNTKNHFGDAALHWAAMSPCERLVQNLIQNGADVNAKGAQGRTALHYAALYSNINSVRSLVEGGADVKATDNEGKTPLHVALDWNAKIGLEREYYVMMGYPSDAGSAEIAVVLIEKGADLYSWPTPVDADIEDKIKQVERALMRRRMCALFDMWILETGEYTNFFQWLPREMGEDVCRLMLPPAPPRKPEMVEDVSTPLSSLKL